MSQYARPSRNTLAPRWAQDLEQAKAQAAAAEQRAYEAHNKMLKSSRDAKVRLRVTAVVMMTLALLKLAWQAANAQPEIPNATVAQPLATSKASAAAVRYADSSQTAVAMERVRDAFHAFPEEDQPDVVREVNERYGASGLTCPLAWKDGKPALTLGDGTPLMASALEQCAKGVEKLRQEKGQERAAK